MESCFTSVLICEIPFKLKTCHFRDFSRKQLKNLLDFSLKIMKMGNIIIHRFHKSRIWWNLKTRSRSIHWNFGLVSSLIYNKNYILAFQNRWNFVRGWLKSKFATSNGYNFFVLAYKNKLRPPKHTLALPMLG